MTGLRDPRGDLRGDPLGDAPATATAVLPETYTLLPPEPSPARPTTGVRRWALVVLAATLVFVVWTSALSVQRQNDYRTYRNDLGNMVQTVYLTAHGHLLEMTSSEGLQISRLGSHVDPILALFALPWLVWPSASMLLIAQAAIVGLAAWPAYRLGLRVLGDPAAAALCAVALLLYPPLQFAVLDEFHPVTLAVPFLLFAFVALEEDHRWRALPFLVLAALCKEDIPLIIAVLGAYFALRKRALWPLLISAGALAYFAVAAGVVIPHYSHAASAFLARYASGESSMSALAWNLLAHPWRAVTCLLDPSGLRYLGDLLWPFAFTSLISPLTALVSLPELLINCLSSKAQQHSVAYHYVAAEVPFLFAATVLGVARVGRWAGRRGWAAAHEAPRLRLLASVVVVVALVATLTVGPLSGARRGWGLVRSPEHRALLNRAVAMVPAGVSVSADSALGAHLSARPRIYIFPVLRNAQYVLLDSEGRYGAQRTRALSRLRRDSDYRVLFAQDGVMLFERVR